MLRTILAIILLVFAAVLIVGGGWLIALGGSPYYVIAGFLLAASAILLLMRRAAGLLIFALLLAGTLVWALVEVGWDWWQLAPRGGVLVLLGLLLLLPAVRRDLSYGSVAPSRRWYGAGSTLAITVGVSLGVALFSMFFVDSNAIGGTVATPADATAEPDGVGGDWPAYGRTLAGQAYSSLTEITRDNVRELEVAWTYNTGDLAEGGNFEATPIEIDDRLFLCTPSQWVIALDAATGEEIWRYEPEISDDALQVNRTCRGVSYYEVDIPAGEPCARRIYLPTSDARLIALDADDGTLCTEFAEGGWIDLLSRMPFAESGLYYVNSPPVVASGVIVVGGSISDNVTVNSPSGVIRGYDATTGELLWNFDPGNPGETEPLSANEVYVPASPNSWAPMTADEELGLVFVPMGNPPPDHYGAERTPEFERFSTSVLAVDLFTGALAWVFQTIHHDLWDMDIPAQPVLVDLDMQGETVPALVQPTKQGDVFVLDRRTGEPLLPVEEIPAPQGAISDDYTPATQPISALSFRPTLVEERDMWGVTMFDQLACRILFRQMRYEGRYTPPGTDVTIQHPGNWGIFNWGGIGVDPVRQVMFGTPSYVAFTIQLVPRPDDITPIVTEEPPHNGENFGAPYAVDINTFLSPIGIPCQAPPWGYVAAADLRTGEIVWMHKNGTVRDLAPIPLPFRLGVPDLGGPVVTATGLAFISGTLDYYVRAFDVETGEELWRDRLPAGGHATPMTYATDEGRQFLVVVSGGHTGLGTTRGDAVTAYALPRE